MFLWPQVVDEEFLPSPHASSQIVSSALGVSKGGWPACLVGHGGLLDSVA